MTQILSGNEAIARGAYEAGVNFAAGYPGTPSTEILENVVKYKSDIYCEWAPNEKVAFEAAAAAAFAGGRAIVTLKHVGLNVAADPLMTMGYIGTEGGFVVCVADDPGMHSSQNEQDSRHYARMAKIPMFEPSDSTEAKEFLAIALDLSEKYQTPTMIRLTTRISHSRTIVELGERVENKKTIGFVKNPSRFVTVPGYARQMRVKVEERTKKLIAEANKSPINQIQWQDKKLGIITSSISYQYVKQVWPEASVLKLGMPYPFPDDLIAEFAGGVEKVLIVEELDNFLEEHIKSLGIDCVGKEFVPNIGELGTDVLAKSKAMMQGGQKSADTKSRFTEPLPVRRPVLCPGCPHRGIFAALKKLDVIVAGDIGCYSLGALKPLESLDIILCMGGGVSMAHGLDKVGEPKKVVGMVGDSTFFHSGITGLLDIAYNKGCSTIIVVDNRTTAMTGHQDHPGTGLTLMNEKTAAISIPEIAKACGFKRVFTVNPYDSEQTDKILSTEINVDEHSLIVSRGACPLQEKKPVGQIKMIDSELCKNCGKCLKLGCPAIDGSGEKPTINKFFCSGCGLCQQACPFDAISIE